MWRQTVRAVFEGYLQKASARCKCTVREGRESNAVARPDDPAGDRGTTGCKPGGTVRDRRPPGSTGCGTAGRRGEGFRTRTRSRRNRMPVRAPVTKARRPVRRTNRGDIGCQALPQWLCQGGRPRIGESGVGSDAGPICLSGVFRAAVFQTAFPPVFRTCALRSRSLLHHAAPHRSAARRAAESDREHAPRDETGAGATGCRRAPDRAFPFRPARRNEEVSG